MRLQRPCHPPITPNNSLPSGYCLHINSCENQLRTRTDTSNQAQAFPHTSQNTYQSNIAILNAISMPNNFLPSGYCLHINSCRNHLRTHEDTSNQARAFPHTSQNTHQSNIANSNVIAVPLPSTDKAKQFLTIRLLPPH